MGTSVPEGEALFNFCAWQDRHDHPTAMTLHYDAGGQKSLFIYGSNKKNPDPGSTAADWTLLLSNNSAADGLYEVPAVDWVYWSAVSTAAAVYVNGNPSGTRHWGLTV